MMSSVLSQTCETETVTVTPPAELPRRDPPDSQSPLSYSGLSPLRSKNSRIRNLKMPQV
jgi:hypothetical protein